MSLSEKIKGQWWKIGSEWQIMVWKACHCKSQFKQAEMPMNWFKKINKFLRDTAEKFNIGLASVSEIIAGLCYKKCVFDGLHIR